MKRNLWDRYFQKLPIWPCPLCGERSLQVEADSLIVVETKRSERVSKTNPNAEPNWYDGRFSAMATCIEPLCGEGAVISGSVIFDYDWDEDAQSAGFIRLFKPALIQPSPTIIDVPSSAPDVVREELNKASALVWLDEQRSANALRTCVERLLTTSGVPQNSPDGSKKLTLFRRLKLFEAEHPNIEKLLTPIRIFGNSGSHEAPEQIEREELLDAFEVIEHALLKLYDSKEEDIAAKAMKLANKK